MVPLLPSLFQGSTSFQLLSVLAVGVVGFFLSGANYLLRFKRGLRSRLNLITAAVFFILYGMIGYPNLIRPGGEVPTGPLILLVIIAAFPFCVLVIATQFEKQAHRQN